MSHCGSSYEKIKGSSFRAVGMFHVVLVDIEYIHCHLYFGTILHT